MSSERRVGRDRRDERGQQDQPQRDAVDADGVPDAEASISVTCSVNWNASAGVVALEQAERRTSSSSSIAATVKPRSGATIWRGMNSTAIARRAAAGRAGSEQMRAHGWRLAPTPRADASTAGRCVDLGQEQPHASSGARRRSALRTRSVGRARPAAVTRAWPTSTCSPRAIATSSSATDLPSQAHARAVHAHDAGRVGRLEHRRRVVVAALPVGAEVLRHRAAPCRRPRRRLCESACAVHRRLEHDDHARLQLVVGVAYARRCASALQSVSKWPSESKSQRYW